MPSRKPKSLIALAALLPSTCLACSLTTSLDGLDDAPRFADAGSEDASAQEDGPPSEDAADADAPWVEAGDADAPWIEAGDAETDSEVPDVVDDATPCGADLQNDPNHCGACDHGCLGGDCTAGKCQPAVVADGQNEPAGITVDDTSVYWVNVANKALKRIPKTGGSQERLDVAADGVTDPFDVAVDGSYLYWSERSGTEVFRKPLAGGAKEHITWGIGACAYLTIGGGLLFVSDFRDDDPSIGHIVSSPVEGSDGMLIYQNQPLAAGIDAVGAELFWARAQPDSIMRGTFDGGPSSTMVTATGTVSGLAYDGSRLYWIEDEQRVMSAELGMGTPELVHNRTAAAGLTDLAVDDTSIWWSERGTGIIARLAK
jgi:hypothetical protein